MCGFEQANADPFGRDAFPLAIGLANRFFPRDGTAAQIARHVEIVDILSLAPSPMRVNYVSGFLQLLEARWQWCQRKSCSNAKKLVKPAMIQAKKLVLMPACDIPAGIM